MSSLHDRRITHEFGRLQCLILAPLGWLCGRDDVHTYLGDPKCYVVRQRHHMNRIPFAIPAEIVLADAVDGTSAAVTTANTKTISRKQGSCREGRQAPKKKPITPLTSAFRDVPEEEGQGWPGQVREPAGMQGTFSVPPLGPPPLGTNGLHCMHQEKYIVTKTAASIYLPRCASANP